MSQMPGSGVLAGEGQPPALHLMVSVPSHAVPTQCLHESQVHAIALLPGWINLLVTMKKRLKLTPRDPAQP